jgi:hypothetical protein
MFRKTIASAVAALAVAGPTLAEEQVLPFALVVSFVDEAPLAAVPEGRMALAARAVGVATFEDGRTAFKEFVILQAGGETGEMTGYSTYTFENGDALHLKFTGGWSADGITGDYELLSGTGAFEGATGTGHFESVEESWDRADLLEGSFTLQMPGT